MKGAGKRLISCDFSSGQTSRRQVDFSLWNLKRQGHAGLANQPDLPFARLQTALRLRPRRALSSAEATDETTQVLTTGNSPTALFRF